MKRRREVDTATPPPSDASDPKSTRQPLKRRRVLGPDSWNGATRRTSALQDINNLSHTLARPLDYTPLAHLGKQPTQVTSPPVLSQPAILEPTFESELLPSQKPASRRLTVPEDAASPGFSNPTPNTSDNPRLSPSPFVSRENSVRIKNLQGFRHGVRGNSKAPDSDSDSEGEESDEVTDDEKGAEGTKETEEDSTERGVVESRYADVNRMLGNLFLSRRRGQA